MDVDVDVDGGGVVVGTNEAEADGATAGPPHVKSQTDPSVLVEVAPEDSNMQHIRKGVGGEGGGESNTEIFRTLHPH